MRPAWTLVAVRDPISARSEIAANKTANSQQRILEEWIKKAAKFTGA